MNALPPPGRLEDESDDDIRDLVFVPVGMEAPRPALLPRSGGLLPPSDQDISGQRWEPVRADGKPALIFEEIDHWKPVAEVEEEAAAPTLSVPMRTWSELLGAVPRQILEDFDAETKALREEGSVRTQTSDLREPKSSGVAEPTSTETVELRQTVKFLLRRIKRLEEQLFAKGGRPRRGDDSPAPVPVAPPPPAPMATADAETVPIRAKDYRNTVPASGRRVVRQAAWYGRSR